MPDPIDMLLAATADFAAPFDPAAHPRGGFPANRGEFSPAGGGKMPGVEPSPPTPPPAAPEPWRMSRAQFYRKYPYQHSIIRPDAAAAHAALMAEGFKSGIGPNVGLATQGPPMTTMDRQYGTRAGRLVYAIPKQAVRDTPNGGKIRDGHKPTEHEAVLPARDYEPLHEAVVRTALEKGHPVPPKVLAEYPHLMKPARDA